MLFIPFIIIQIMCLYMRVHQYGLTQTRYLGILLIVFEVFYEAFYITRFVQKKGLGGIIFPVLIIFVFIYYLMPGINVYASVTNSQKNKVDRIVSAISEGTTPSSQELAGAKSAYNEIDNNGGAEGNLYLKKVYAAIPKQQLEDVLYNGSIPSGSESLSMYADADISEIDISGYSKLLRVDMSLFDTDFNPESVLIRNDADDDAFEKVDLSELINALRSEKYSDPDTSDFDDLIKDPVFFKDGSVLYIEYLYLEENSEREITDFSLRGYYLYN